MRKVLVDNLNRLRKDRCIAKIRSECVCVFGSQEVYTHSSGCPEIRIASAIIAALTPEEWQTITKRVGLVVCGKARVDLSKDPGSVESGLPLVGGNVKAYKKLIDQIDEVDFKNPESSRALRNVMRRVVYCMDAIEKKIISDDQP